MLWCRGSTGIPRGKCQILTLNMDDNEGHTCGYCDEAIKIGAIRMDDGLLYHDYCFEALARRDIRTEEDIQEVIE